MNYFVQKRKKGTPGWKTFSTYDTKHRALAECRWRALHLVSFEELKKRPLVWEYRVITDANIVLLHYIIVGNERVKASIN